MAVGGHIAVDPAFLQRFPALAIVSNFGVGYDSIDAAWAGQNGLVVTNTPGVLDEEVADTAIGLMLATVRQLPAAERHLRAGKWPDGAFPLSHTLRGRTVGILGLGRIGKAIAKRAEAFGLAVVYHGRRPQADVPYLYYPTLVGMAQACDILVIITPGGSETRHLVGAEVLKALGPAGILINVARGSVVDEERPHRGLAGQDDPRRRARRLRRRTARAPGLARPRPCRAAAACRIGLASYP